MSKLLPEWRAEKIIDICTDLENERLLADIASSYKTMITDKGIHHLENKLERTVESIEKFLSDYIDLKDIQRVDIKTNYRDSVDGVEYEIDVFKKMKKSDGETIILFEGKNWESKKVGAIDIVYFNEKIVGLETEKGYFIGTKFTKSAKEKAKQYLKMKVVNLRKNFDILKTPFVSFSPSRKNTKVKKIDFFNGDKEIIITETSIYKYEGRKRPKSYIMAIIINELFTKLDRGCKDRCKSTIEEPFKDFKLDMRHTSLEIEGEKVTSVLMTGTLVVLVNPEEIIVDYSVSGRGRNIRTRSISEDSHGLSFEMDITFAI